RAYNRNSGSLGDQAGAGHEPDRPQAVSRGGEMMTVAGLPSRRGESMIGLKELALLAVVVLVLYGRSGVVKSRQFQTIWPWIAPVRRTPRRPGGLRAPAVGLHPAPQSPVSSSPGAPAGSQRLRLEGNRLFWFLTILAATAVAALIITRLLILNGAGPGVTR